MKMEKLEFLNDKKESIVKILTKKGFSFNFVQKLLKNKDILIDEKRIKKDEIIQLGSKVCVFYNKKNNYYENLVPVFEDDNLLIINKPNNIEIEGKDGLCQKFNALAVHRLDRNTCGLVILAKNEIAKQSLMQAFKNRDIEKYYHALVYGKTNFDGKIYKAYLVKDSNMSLVKIYDKKVKGAVEIQTQFWTLKNFEQSSTVLCKLLTGKTHQLRAHLSFLGHFIVGDGKYGKNEINKKFDKKYQTLTCTKLVFHNLQSPLQYLNEKEFNCEFLYN